MSLLKLTCVSITGADDPVAVGDLNALAREFPFVEWAILLMPERMGQKRFPSESWIRTFVHQYEGAHTAMHLCGGAFLGFIEGREDILSLMKGFRRIQLNLEFGDVEGQYDPLQLIHQIRENQEFEFVIQYTDKRRDFVSLLRNIPNHALLFDTSAGRGVSPESWPAPLDGHVCGYAGGLKPENLQGNLEKIARAANGRETWIDMESGVRTDDRFDLERVRRVLEVCAPSAR